MLDTMDIYIPTLDLSAINRFQSQANSFAKTMSGTFSYVEKMMEAMQPIIALQETIKTQLDPLSSFVNSIQNSLPKIHVITSRPLHFWLLKVMISCYV